MVHPMRQVLQPESFGTPTRAEPAERAAEPGSASASKKALEEAGEAPGVVKLCLGMVSNGRERLVNRFVDEN